MRERKRGLRSGRDRKDPKDEEEGEGTKAMVISDLEKGRSVVMVSRVLVEGKISDFYNPASSPPPSPLHLQPPHPLHPPPTVPIRTTWLKGLAVMRVLRRRRHASPSKTLASPTSPFLFRVSSPLCDGGSPTSFPLCDGGFVLNSNGGAPFFPVYEKIQYTHIINCISSRPFCNCLSLLSNCEITSA